MNCWPIIRCFAHQIFRTVENFGKLSQNGTWVEINSEVCIILNFIHLYFETRFSSQFHKHGRNIETNISSKRRCIGIIMHLRNYFNSICSTLEELGRYWNLSRVDSLIKISLWIIISLWWSSWENVSKPGLMSLFATSLGHNVSKTSLNLYLKLFALKISQHLFTIFRFQYILHVSKAT